MNQWLNSPEAQEALSRFEEVMRRGGYKYYLIGAQAIHLYLELAKQKPIRTTRDIDFAVETESAEAFEMLSSRLKDAGFVLFKKSLAFSSVDSSLQIDLIPFGKLERRRMIQIPGSSEELSVLGFREVLSGPVEVEFSGFKLKMPSLAGLTVLKLLSWSERPTHRIHDLGDIYKIISHYSDIFFSEILDYHPDLIPIDGEPDWLLIGAELLGRHVRDVSRRSNELDSRITGLINTIMITSAPGSLVETWSAQSGISLEYGLQVGTSFASGYAARG